MEYEFHLDVNWHGNLVYIKNSKSRSYSIGRNQETFNKCTKWNWFIDLISGEDEKIGRLFWCLKIRSWMNNNAIGHIKNLGGELVDLWKANNLYLSYIVFCVCRGKSWEVFNTQMIEAMRG